MISSIYNIKYLNLKMKRARTEETMTVESVTQLLPMPNQQTYDAYILDRVIIPTDHKITALDTHNNIMNYYNGLTPEEKTLLVAKSSQCHYNIRHDINTIIPKLNMLNDSSNAFNTAISRFYRDKNINIIPNVVILEDDMEEGEIEDEPALSRNTTGTSGTSNSSILSGSTIETDDGTLSLLTIEDIVQESFKIQSGTSILNMFKNYYVEQHKRSNNQPSSDVSILSDMDEYVRSGITVDNNELVNKALNIQRVKTRNDIVSALTRYPNDYQSIINTYIERLFDNDYRQSYDTITKQMNDMITNVDRILYLGRTYYSNIERLFTIDEINEKFTKLKNLFKCMTMPATASVQNVINRLNTRLHSYDMNTGYNIGNKNTFIDDLIEFYRNGTINTIPSRLLVFIQYFMNSKASTLEPGTSRIVSQIIPKIYVIDGANMSLQLSTTSRNVIHRIAKFFVRRCYDERSVAIFIAKSTSALDSEYIYYDVFREVVAIIAENRGHRGNRSYYDIVTNEIRNLYNTHFIVIIPRLRGPTVICDVDARGDIIPSGYDDFVFWVIMNALNKLIISVSPTQHAAYHMSRNVLQCVTNDKQVMGKTNPDINTENKKPKELATQIERMSSDCEIIYDLCNIVIDPNGYPYDKIINEKYTDTTRIITDLYNKLNSRTETPTNTIYDYTDWIANRRRLFNNDIQSRNSGHGYVLDENASELLLYPNNIFSLFNVTSDIFHDRYFYSHIYKTQEMIFGIKERSMAQSSIQTLFE